MKGQCILTVEALDGSSLQPTQLQNHGFSRPLAPLEGDKPTPMDENLSFEPSSSIFPADFSSYQCDFASSHQIDAAGHHHQNFDLAILSQEASKVNSQQFVPHLELSSQPQILSPPGLQEIHDFGPSMQLLYTRPIIDVADSDLIPRLAPPCALDHWNIRPNAQNSTASSTSDFLDGPYAPLFNNSQYATETTPLTNEHSSRGSKSSARVSYGTEGHMSVVSNKTSAIVTPRILLLTTLLSLVPSLSACLLNRRKSWLSTIPESLQGIETNNISTPHLMFS